MLFLLAYAIAVFHINTIIAGGYDLLSYLYTRVPYNNYYRENVHITSPKHDYITAHTLSK